MKFAQAVVGKDAAKLEPQRVTLRVPFTPDGAGQRTRQRAIRLLCLHGGDLFLMEKRDLALVVDVK